MRRMPTLRAVVTFLVRNWPLKLAAIAFATLLYAGLVLSQDSEVAGGPIPVTTVNQPANSVVTNQLHDLEEIRYYAPADAGRLNVDDFQATVDLSGVSPSGQPTSVPVRVVPLDSRVVIVDVRPRTVQVILDRKASETMAVQVVHGTNPAGLELRSTTVTPSSVQVAGAASIISTVAGVRATVTLDPGGLDLDVDVQPVPVDVNGQVVNGVDIEPRTVNVKIVVITNRANRTLPVNPVLSGVPAPGFRVASVSVAPLVVAVEGDGDQLTALTRIDTVPVPVLGATSDVRMAVGLALPTGVVALDDEQVTVTVKIVPITETRTFVAGFRLDGTRPGLAYTLSNSTTLLTLFGSVASLDQLEAAPIVIALDASALDVGSHDLPVVATLPSDVTIAGVSPGMVTVTVTVAAASPSP